MNEDDFEYEHWFDDNHYDDPNLSFPNHFITCFGHEELPRYQAAIDEFENRRLHKLGSLEIDTSGQWNSARLPALLCWSRGDLKEFWQIFNGLSDRP